MPTKKEELIEYYYNQKLSQSQTATKMCISRSRVGQLIKEFGFSSRNYAESSSNMNNQRTIQFNNHQKDLMFGSMLGDAGFYRNIMRSNKTNNEIEVIRMTFAHSIKQYDYILHKKKIMGGTKIGERTSGHGSIIKYFSVCHTPSLRPYCEYFLNNDYKKLVKQSWVDELNWRSIAYWFMDDGELIIKDKGKYPVIGFHTESFDINELRLLRDKLSELGLTTSTRICNKNPNQLKIISKHHKEVANFLEQIKEYIIPTMKYKIRWIL